MLSTRVLSSTCCVLLRRHGAPEQVFTSGRWHSRSMTQSLGPKALMLCSEQLALTSLSTLCCSEAAFPLVKTSSCSLHLKADRIATIDVL